MKDILTFLRISESGLVQLLSTRKGTSGKQELFYNRSFTTYNIFEPYYLRPFIYEIFEQAVIRVKEVIVIIPSKYYDITQNRGYIIRESPFNEINEIDTTELRNDFFAVHAPLGMKVVNVIPLKYSVDEIINISNPIGMCGTRLEGTFKLLFANKNLIDNISKSLTIEGICIKKYISGKLNDADAFLTSEETEALSIIDLNN